MTAEEIPKMPRAQLVYGEIIYWLAIAAAIICMIGPVIDGKNTETIWQEVGGGFPGGHFWFKNFTKGDGFTQFGLALGCACALWALIATAIAYLREKVYLYVSLSLWVALLVFLAATGIVGGH